MSDREIEIEDLLLVDILKDEFKKNRIDLNKITTYDCHLSGFVEELISKDIVIIKGSLFDYELKCKNVRIITEASLVVKDNEKIYENITYIVEIAKEPKKNNKTQYIRYNNVFKNPLTRIKKIRFHTEGAKYNNINSLILSREDTIYKNKRHIFRIINGIDLSELPKSRFIPTVNRVRKIKQLREGH